MLTYQTKHILFLVSGHKIDTLSREKGDCPMNEIGKIEILKAGQIAKALGVRENTVYVWCKRGMISHYRLGKCVRFKFKDVEEFLEKRRVEARKMK